MSQADRVSAAESQAALFALISARLGEEAQAWLREAAQAEGEARAGCLSEVARRVGRRGLIAGFAERGKARCAGTEGPLPVGHLRCDEAARVFLLASYAQASEAPFAALFQSYDAGDTETRAAALRALNFVGPASGPAEVEQGLELVRDGGRTYLSELLGAAWCHNPFSSKHLPLRDFRKAVLKAFFSELSVAGFLGLEERADADLAQSLCEYIDERLAAGRSVPREIWPIAALHPRPGLVARLIGNLEHPDAQERAVAARALGNARDPRAESFLRERLEREADAEVRASLERALAPH